ncbi:hypothetical protein X975_00057, partial [Stegodyphus mimosarum]
MFSCVPCNKIFNGIQPYKDHMVSEKHRKKVNQPLIASSEEKNYLSHGVSELSLSPYVQNRGNFYICTLCAAHLNSSQQLQSHLYGSKHNRMVNMQGGMPADNTSNEDNYKDELSATFKFHDLLIKDVMGDVKFFKADEPIIF